MVDLHALANQPGYGKAFKELDALGLIGEDKTAPQWTVDMIRDRTFRARMLVRANSEAEAKMLAEKRAERDPYGVEWHECDWADDGIAESAILSKEE